MDQQASRQGVHVDTPRHAPRASAPTRGSKPQMPRNSLKEKAALDGVSVPGLGFARFVLPGKQNKWDSIYTAGRAAQDEDPASGGQAAEWCPGKVQGQRSH